MKIVIIDEFLKKSDKDYGDEVKSKQKKWMLILFVPIMMIIVANFSTFSFSKDEREYKRNLLTMLEKRYEKDFKILDVKKTGNEGFGTYRYAEVLCKDDGIEFEVGGGWDTYLKIRWSRQAEEYYQSIYEEIYEDSFAIRVDYNITPQRTYGMEQLNFEEAYNYCYEKNVPSYMEIIAFRVVEEETYNAKDEAKKIFTINNDIGKDEKIDSYKFRFIILTDRDINKKKTVSIDDFWASGIDERYKTIEIIYLKDEDEIISEEDVENMFGKED